ncbi:MAG: PD-(D/E)XK motif protein [Mesorhizobium sp.]|nr:PD-(D/E)XK motif protein [Mesorhizobium sp. M5C.F.Cr.IN.023.01.1.1]RWF83860.1 MAG: PD-(D/E)XK motif protein [Mesorhizobium sp.]RWF95623.1 MAG: PD-(D/E)XK motif protein [Mesorhizobium sp.]RWI40280.1 MAG: PD-(D/E)XK motif protein [Mesorhizobium sp.]RWI45961.1 MAG: PD-(D/E)XK motif protein [Mesorhizobium sp.]
MIAAWRDLRARKPPGEELSPTTAVTRDDEETGLELAIDAAGALHLLAPAAGSPNRELPPDYNGLRLRQAHLGETECLDLQSPAAHEVMFAALCGQVIEAIYGEGRDPWAAAVSIVRSWQSAWKPVRQPMSRKEQIGLVGELLMLQVVWLRALGPDAVHLWSGPDKERHDFVSDRLHMEVKATTRSRHEHEISRVDQLIAPQGRRLLFASVQLEESAAGAQSLVTLIDGVIDDIRRDAAAVDGFMTRLNALNWSDEMRRSPDLVRFHFRDVQIFEVDEEFPGLPQSFQLPPGVLAIRYIITVANLPVLDSAEVLADISALANGRV